MLSRGFWRWFGASKVVKADGSPMVQYHGTLHDFHTFDTARGGELGSHFGSAEQANVALGYWHARKRTGTLVMPVYLSIQNPIRLVDQGHFGRICVGPQLQRLGIAVELPASIEEAKGLLVAAGYDGVVYRNTREGDSDSYIAFHPHQIKSALGNNGCFEASNPDICR